MKYISFLLLVACITSNWLFGMEDWLTPNQRITLDYHYGNIKNRLAQINTFLEKNPNWSIIYPEDDDEMQKMAQEINKKRKEHLYEQSLLSGKLTAIGLLLNSTHGSYVITTDAGKEILKEFGVPIKSKQSRFKRKASSSHHTNTNRNKRERK